MDVWRFMMVELVGIVEELARSAAKPDLVAKCRGHLVVIEAQELADKEGG